MLPEAKHKSKHQRVRELLQKQGRAYNYELNRICFRYSAIIHDLRKEGHLIVTNCVDSKTGLYEFVYKGKEEGQE